MLHYEAQNVNVVLGSGVVNCWGGEKAAFKKMLL